MADEREMFRDETLDRAAVIEPCADGWAVHLEWPVGVRWSRDEAFRTHDAAREFAERIY